MSGYRRRLLGCEQRAVYLTMLQRSTACYPHILQQGESPQRFGIPTVPFDRREGYLVQKETLAQADQQQSSLLDGIRPRYAYSDSPTALITVLRVTSGANETA